MGKSASREGEIEVLQLEHRHAGGGRLLWYHRADAAWWPPASEILNHITVSVREESRRAGLALALCAHIQNREERNRCATRLDPAVLQWVHTLGDDEAQGLIAMELLSGAEGCTL